MDEDLFLSFLAMDSYNRGNNAELEFGAGSDAHGVKLGFAIL